MAYGETWVRPQSKQPSGSRFRRRWARCLWGGVRGRSEPCAQHSAGCARGVLVAVLTLVPGGKHFHMVTSVFNVFLQNLEARGKLPPAPQFGGVAGVGKVEQFTWRRMLDWYTCTECGRCEEVGSA